MDEKKRENRRWLWAAAAALTAVWALLALLVMNRWRVEIQMNGQEQTVLEYAQEYADPGGPGGAAGGIFSETGAGTAYGDPGTGGYRPGWVPRRLSTGRRYWACGDRRCAG